MKKKTFAVFMSLLLFPSLVSLGDSFESRTISLMTSNPFSSHMIVNWTETQKILPLDGTSNDCFGYSVVLSGETALIGAYRDDDNGVDSGSVYVFVHSGSSWAQQTKLLASDGEAGDLFGSCVSLSGDTALIGAVGDDDNGVDSGSAYVFIRSGSSWTQQAKLLASDGEAGDMFGWSLSLSEETILIGALNDDDRGVKSGSAYVFTRSGSNWMQQAKLHAEDGTSHDFFGCSVSLCGDTALIGAHGNDEDGAESGSAYVFIRSGDVWMQQAKLLAIDRTTGDYFGWSVSLDGDTALIGADGDDDKGDDSGSAYVFTWSGSSWTQQAKLLASDGDAHDVFGWSVSLSKDTALIGAPYDDGVTDAGSAYVFIRSGTSWAQQAKMRPFDSTEADRFGWRVSLWNNTALFGVRWDEDNGFDSGSAYVFTRVNENEPPIVSIPSPANGSINQSLNLHWSIPIVDREGDLFSWTIACSNGQVQNEVNASNGTKFLDLTGLTYARTYKIWVNVTDPTGSALSTRKWFTFTTKINQPPDSLVITGPPEAKVGHAVGYNFTAIDPESDDVYYFIDWGDSMNSSWLGPYHSGEQITKVHTWSKKANYTLRAKAKDIYGNEMDWVEVVVRIPKGVILMPSFLQAFLESVIERYPFLSSILHIFFTFHNAPSLFV